MSADSTVPLGFLIYIFLGDLMVIFYVEISSAAAWNSVTPKKKSLDERAVLCFTLNRDNGYEKCFKLFWMFVVVHMELKHKICIIVYEKWF